MRNLGGAIGLAAINTILNNRTDLHIQRLHEAVTFSSRAAMERLDALAAGFASFGSDAHAMALKTLSRSVHQQAAVMAFADVFLILCLLFVILAVMAVLVKRPGGTAAPGGH